MIRDFDKNLSKLSGIYRIQSLIDSRFYIGSASYIGKRYGNHKQSLLKNNHYNIKLQRFVNKYGIDNLKFTVLRIVKNKENLKDIEQLYINYLKPYENGFNIAKNVYDMSHIPTNKKIEYSKKATLGIKRDNEFCQKVRNGLKDYYKYNKHHLIGSTWSKSRRDNIRKAFLNNPEKYKNKKPSTGNKKNHCRGSKHYLSKINEQIAFNIKTDIANNLKTKDILLKYNVSRNIYKDIKRNKTWKHISIIK